MCLFWLYNEQGVAQSRFCFFTLETELFWKFTLICGFNGVWLESLFCCFHFNVILNAPHFNFEVLDAISIIPVIISYKINCDEMAYYYILWQMRSGSHLFRYFGLVGLCHRHDEVNKLFFWTKRFINEYIDKTTSPKFQT